MDFRNKLQLSAFHMMQWRMNVASKLSFLPRMNKFASEEVGQIGIGDIPNFVVLLGLAGVSGSVMLLILVELQITNDTSATVNGAIDKVISGIDKIFDFFDILGLAVIAAIIIAVIFSAFAFGQFQQRQGRQGF